MHTEGTCDYAEEAVTDRGRGVFGVLRNNTPLTSMTSTLRSVTYVYRYVFSYEHGNEPFYSINEEEFLKIWATIHF